jgi:hypothetical protein
MSAKATFSIGKATVKVNGGCVDCGADPSGWHDAGVIHILVNGRGINASVSRCADCPRVAAGPEPTPAAKRNQ